MFFALINVGIVTISFGIFSFQHFWGKRLGALFERLSPNSNLWLGPLLYISFVGLSLKLLETNYVVNVCTYLIVPISFFPIVFMVDSFSQCCEFEVIIMPSFLDISFISHFVHEFINICLEYPYLLSASGYLEYIAALYSPPIPRP